MFEWLKPNPQSFAFSTIKQDVERFTRNLQAKDKREVGAIVALSTHWRKVLRKDGVDVLDPVEVELRNPAFSLQLNRLIARVQQAAPGLAPGLMVWAYSIRTANAQDLRSDGKAMWAQLGRGFPYARSAGRDLNSLLGIELQVDDAPVIPRGLEPDGFVDISPSDGEQDGQSSAVNAEPRDALNKSSLGPPEGWEEAFNRELDLIGQSPRPFDQDAILPKSLRGQDPLERQLEIARNVILVSLPLGVATAREAAEMLKGGPIEDAEWVNIREIWERSWQQAQKGPAETAQNQSPAEGAEIGRPSGPADEPMSAQEDDILQRAEVPAPPQEIEGKGSVAIQEPPIDLTGKGDSELAVLGVDTSCPPTPPVAGALPSWRPGWIGLIGLPLLAGLFLALMIGINILARQGAF